MARLPRYVLPGQPQHVIQRGNNRSAMFAADADFALFLRCLGAACERHACVLHAYVFMTNHIHLLVTPHTEHAIGRVMQSVGRRYVRYFNIVYRRTGTLWEGRYRASLIDSDQYLLSCYRYIELNPVRSQQVTDPGEYRWSSYRANALGQHDPLITPHQQYAALGPDAESRCRAYRALFLARLTSPTLDDIRQSTRRGWPLGSDHFRHMVSTLLQRRAHRLSKGGDRRSEAYRAARPIDTAGASAAINRV